MRPPGNSKAYCIQTPCRYNSGHDNSQCCRKLQYRPVRYYGSVHRDFLLLSLHNCAMRYRKLPDDPQGHSLQQSQLPRTLRLQKQSRHSILFSCRERRIFKNFSVAVYLKAHELKVMGSVLPFKKGDGMSAFSRSQAISRVISSSFLSKSPCPLCRP